MSGKQAETVPPAQVATHEAGGGVSGQARAVKHLNAHVLAHLKKLYHTHAGKPDEAWHGEQIVAFLKNVQGASDEEISKESLGQKDWALNDFLRYMTSSSANVIVPSNPKTQDLSWPLSSYFVSSSHNTYLTGNQLYSESSTDAYKNVLLRGCRCIEIDVWDGDDSGSESGGGSSTSVFSSDGDDPKAYQKRKARLQRAKGKMPGSLASRLDKSSLGRKLDEYVDKKKPDPASAATAPAEASAAKTAEDTPDPKVQATAPGPLQAIVEPRVLHGYTLTKEVSFRDVCVAVRDDAFTASDLPLIVSLEVHCSADQQEAMVKIMEEIWKEFLLPEPDGEVHTLPAPGSLRHKILIKVKYAPPNQAVGSSTAEADAEDSDEERLPEGTAPKRKKKPAKIIQALSRLGIYTRGVSFKSLTQPEAAMPTHIFSLSENGVVGVQQEHSRELFRHNRNFLMRAYPSGLRIRSSNLDPVDFWSKGIQIVALNWQKWDEGMMLNEAMFAGTGGYVLKPEGYRTTHRPSNSSAPTTQDVASPHHKHLDLTIEVLAAQSLPLPSGDSKASSFRPYVKVELHAEDEDEDAGNRFGRHLSAVAASARSLAKEGRYKARTRTARGGGRDPDFGAQALGFGELVGPAAIVEELTFARFTVRNDEIGRDELVAWACVRLDRLGTGYRFVHLLDAAGVETEGVVLIRVTKKLA